MNKKIILACTLVLIAVGGYFLLNRPTTPTPEISPTPTLADVPREATLQGEYTCLPHKNTDGPTTLECALGIKADDGFYYALDTNGVTSDIATGQRISVEGTLVPIEQISSDHWQKYDIKGIMKVKVLK